MAFLHRLSPAQIPHRISFLLLVMLILSLLGIWIERGSSSSQEEKTASAEYTVAIKRFSTPEDAPWLKDTMQFELIQNSYFNLKSKPFAWLKISNVGGALSPSSRVLINIKRNNIFTPIKLYHSDGTLWQQRSFVSIDSSYKDFVAVMPSSIESPVVYVQLSGRYLRGNVQLLSDSELIRQSKADSIIDGVYFGILALFIFFNLIVYKVFNRVSHLSYSLLLTLTFIWIASGQGWIFFFNEQLMTVPVFTPNSLGILFSLATALFSRQFLQMKVISPVINKVLYYNQLLAIAFWFLYIVTYQSLPHFVFQIGYVLCSINALVIFLGSILGAIAGINRGRNNAKFYLLAIIVLISMAVSMSISASGLVNIPFSWHTLQLASVLEVAILSVGFVVEHYQKHRELEEIKHKLKDLESEFKRYKISTDSLKSNLSDNLFDSQLIPVLAKVLPILPHLLFVKADGNYCVASYKNENRTDELFIDCNLQLLLDSIGDEKLLRCHKSYLVNLSQPYQLKRRTSADYDLVTGENRIPIGRKYLSTVRKCF